MATITYLDICIANENTKIQKKIQKKIQIMKKPFLLNRCIQPVYIYTDMTDNREIVTYYTNGGDLHYYPVVTNHILWNYIKKHYPELLPMSSKLAEEHHS